MRCLHLDCMAARHVERVTVDWERRQEGIGNGNARRPKASKGDIVTSVNNGKRSPGG